MASDNLIRRWWRQLRFDVPPRMQSDAAAPGLREGLLARRKIVATMVSRAAREVGLQAGVAMETPAGSVRAAQLQRLRREGLWESVPAPLQAALAAPEGSWDTETTGRGCWCTWRW